MINASFVTYRGTICKRAASDRFVGQSYISHLIIVIGDSVTKSLIKPLHFNKQGTYQALLNAQLALSP